MLLLPGKFSPPTIFDTFLKLKMIGGTLGPMPFYPPVKQRLPHSAHSKYNQKQLKKFILIYLNLKSATHPPFTSQL
jgi:hypothetical protein